MAEGVEVETGGAAMADQETQVQVRTLSGDSITLSISPGKTIHDLKVLLRQRFSRAITSPSFHLYLRGAKLGLKSQVGSQRMNSNEFMVLVPFTKKAETGSDGEIPKPCQPSSSPNPAQSVRSEDLSSLGSTVHSKDDSLDEAGLPRKHRRLSDEKKKDSYASDEVVSIILQSVSKNVMDDDVCRSFVRVLESVNCFSDVQSGKCMILNKPKPNLPSKSGIEKSVLCACPPWLKVLMKAFSFLNIFWGFMLAQLKRVTVDSVRDALDKLRKLGLGVSMEDLSHLSVICPEVVYFCDYEAESDKSHSMLITISLREQDGNTVIIERRTPLSRIINTLKRRETFFRTKLQDVFECYMDHVKDGHKTLNSLDELITLAKEAGSSIFPNNGNQASASNSTPRRCHKTHQLSPSQIVEHLRNGFGAQGQIVHVEEISGRMASFSDIPDGLSENARSSLKSLGISKLYSHQADSVRASLAGQNVLVSTTTSSGKSLCYNLPVLEAMTEDMLSCALYLFPTKALAQDQLRALQTMTEGFGTNLAFGVYDGDTSQADRLQLRDNARLLITNPDMLHVSILPFHKQFKRILSNLRYVVIDEAHTYKGPFGCHTALILRRLRRICSHVYGSDPSFVFCTATSTNPCQHAMSLANLSTLELIQKDGSPSGPKQFVLWNPPLLSEGAGGKTNEEEPVLATRSSPMVEISQLLAEMLQHGLRCIAFCKTRKFCELVLSYTRDILKVTAPHLMDSVRSYRGGYVAKDRRRIESEVFGGKICGIAATNALELGIDVGEIDVTLHLGFPGSIASLWQQAGRSGRRGRPSVAVYVAFDGPLDQYFMTFPEKLFRSPIECCHVDAQNPQVLEQHLLCAAVELPLSSIHDEKYFGSGLRQSIISLANVGNLSSNPSRSSSATVWRYIGHEKLPSRAINIRSIESERYEVIDKQTNEVLEEIEESRAFFQVYEGAVYMNQGNTYLVQELKLSSKIAVCQRADLKYYTRPLYCTDIHVRGGGIAYSARTCNLTNTTAQAHPCKVTTRWHHFSRVCKKSHKAFAKIELSLPPFSYESQAVWVQVPQSVKTAVMRKDLPFHLGIHAASHAARNVVPLYVICNSSDLASECVYPDETRYMPERILLYDPHPGGTGLSRQIQPVFSKILNTALELLTSCRCTMSIGCPNCTQNFACSEYNVALHKEAAIMIIQGVLESEKLAFEEGAQSNGPLDRS